MVMILSYGLFLFFFFKQKTAYEMRISDWSSDVCSSDLAAALGLGGEAGTGDADERNQGDGDLGGFLHGGMPFRFGSGWDTQQRPGPSPPMNIFRAFSRSWTAAVAPGRQVAQTWLS